MSKSLVFNDEGTLQKFPDAAGYDLVISNQTEFNEWIAMMDNGDSVGATVLIRPGTYYFDDHGIPLPPDLRLISGYGVTIFATLTYDSACNRSDVSSLFYPYMKVFHPDSYTTDSFLADFPSSLYDLTVKGLHIVLTINDTPTKVTSAAFYQINNLVDVRVTIFEDGTPLVANTASAAFYACRSLTGCTARLIVSGRTQTPNLALYGFLNSYQLTNCTAIFSGSNPDDTNSGIKLAGFYTCYGLSNCMGYITASITPFATVSSAAIPYTFSNCSLMTSCSSTTHGCSIGQSLSGNTKLRTISSPKYIAACYGLYTYDGTNVDLDSTGWCN